MAVLPRFSLWHSADTRSLRILWTLSELGLRRCHDYTLHQMPFPPRQRVPGYERRNPLGTVPWFEHSEPGDAAPRAAMSESCAVPLYLATLLESSLAVRTAEPSYAAFLNWLFHADATLTFPQSVVMRYRLLEPERGLDGAADDYARWFVARLRLLNAVLEDGRPFLCADRMTIADVSIAYALFNASEHGLCGGGFVERGAEPLSARYKPATRAYLDRMMARPAWRAAQEVQMQAAREAECTEEVVA